MFESATGHGFRMTFNNGYSVSVQWGPSNYCSNQNKRLSLTGTDMDSATAECAVFSPNGQFVRMAGWHDDVNGHNKHHHDDIEHVDKHNPDHRDDDVEDLAGLPSISRLDGLGKQLATSCLTIADNHVSLQINFILTTGAQGRLGASLNL